MIIVTVFLSISNTNGIPFGSENRKENCHHDHIPLNEKGNGNIVFSVYEILAGRICCRINNHSIIYGAKADRLIYSWIIIVIRKYPGYYIQILYWQEKIYN